MVDEEKAQRIQRLRASIGRLSGEIEELRRECRGKERKHSRLRHALRLALEESGVLAGEKGDFVVRDEDPDCVGEVELDLTDKER